MTDSKKPVSNIKEVKPSKRNWSAEGLFWGSLVMLIGVMLLLNNLGVYEFDISRIWQLWPIVIIGIGISMLSLKGVLAVIVTVALILATLGAVLFVTTSGGDERPRDESRQEVSVEPSQSSESESSEVEIKTGGGTLDIKSDSSVGLADATLVSDRANLNQSNETNNDREKVRIESRVPNGGWPGMIGGNIKNDLTVKLAEDRQINLRVDTGAAKVTADLKDVRLQKLSLDTGASSADIKLGDLLKRLDVDIDTGASSLVLRVPKDSGVQVSHSSGLSSSEFEGMTEVSEGVHETKDFASSSKKIYIKADTGMSSFKIVRY